MLILSRKKNESIVISDNVEVTVIGIHKNRIKLGISAPNQIPVHRKEVHEAIQSQMGKK